jgi:hypothetical protein
LNFDTFYLWAHHARTRSKPQALKAWCQPEGLLDGGEAITHYSNIPQFQSEANELISMVPWQEKIE